jgi:hypothetical protein
MKKKAAVTNGKKLAAKKLAANDTQENGKAEKVRSRLADDARFTIGSVATVKRGFLKDFCDFVTAKKTVDAPMLIKVFPKIPEARVRRYVHYCLNHGQLKVTK